MKFFKSVRFKFILWYMAFLTVTLLSFSFVLYGGFANTLYGELDDLLSSKADGVANSVNTYWNAKRMEILAEEKFPVPAALEMEHFMSLARNWVEEKRKDPELMSLFVRILDTEGNVIVSTKPMPRIAPPDKEDLADILNGEDSFDTIKGESADGKPMKFRVYTKPVIEDGKAAYVVQAAGPLGLVSLALKNLTLILFLVLPLTVLLAGIPGVLLARLTLRPIDKMINTLRQITAENLKLKIHIPDTKDEIKRLADAFNGMIERLDRSFSSQQRFIQDIAQDIAAPARDTKNFSRIMDGLEAFSRFDNNQAVLEIRKVNLKRLLGQVLDEMRPAADEKEISVSFSSPENIVIDGDEDQLRRLFMNLIDNAIRYTYRKGSVSVSASKGGECANVAVSDTGMGIPEYEIDYIFDRFYQVARSRGSGSGFGLGLSSAKYITEAHKGTIAVESRVGKGSTFTVSLPISYPA